MCEEREAERVSALGIAGMLDTLSTKRDDPPSSIEPDFSVEPILARVQGSTSVWGTTMLVHGVSSFPASHTLLVTKASTHTDMSIYLTKHVLYTTRVEAFEKRGLGGQAACKAAESSVYPSSRGPIANSIRFGNLHEELTARLDMKAAYYGDRSKMSTVLSKFYQDFLFEVPTLFSRDEVRRRGAELHCGQVDQDGRNRFL